MCVSQNNNRLFLAIVLGIFLTSGCSGHSVKYGANSEGEGIASEEKVTGPGDSVSYGTARQADGSTMNGGTVHGNKPSLQSGQGTSNTSGDMKSEMAMVDDPSSVPGSEADYGHQFGGVDGSGPHYGAVEGFGRGSAKASHPDPEAWANAYLREKRNSPEFYGDPSTTGSPDHSENGETAQSATSLPSQSEDAETAQYGHEYAGVPESGPNHGAVDGFSQGSASRAETNPEAWAKAYVHENGGASPEYVNSDLDIVQAKEKKDSRLTGIGDSTGELREIRNVDSSFEGRVQDIYFAFDSWSISAEGAKYLEEDAKWLHANPEKALTIEGHCDQRGTQDYNLVLGKKRAEAAREYLVNLGVQPHRLNIVSYGKERPFCHYNNEDCFQENRRNHMVVRMNQS